MIINQRIVLAFLFGALVLVQNSTGVSEAKIYGSTEDVRFIAIVESMLEQKVIQLAGIAKAHGSVTVALRIANDGSLASQELIEKSGHPELDKLALRILVEASPFPPPPHVFERSLSWHIDFGGPLPKLKLQLR